MIELTQAGYEAVEARIIATRELFLSELSKHAELSRLYAKLSELERVGIDARRARREAEIQEGGAS